MAEQLTKCAILVLGTMAGACATSASRAGVIPSAVEESAPRTILLRGDKLAESKRLLGRGDAGAREALRALIATADAALAAPTVSVMEKKHLPPSGNKHDYMSMAPYWWPDSTKPNGLPFIRRDGQMYPDSRVDHD